MGLTNMVLLRSVGSGFPIPKRGTETWETICPELSILLLLTVGQCGGGGQTQTGRREKLETLHAKHLIWKIFKCERE